MLPKCPLFGGSTVTTLFTEEVWKVGRYTSAAPLIFTSIDGYLDGGLLANNPSEDALTAIQNYHRKRKMQVPISLFVSLGTGVMPPKPHHTADISTAIWKAPSQFFPFMTVIGEAVGYDYTTITSFSIDVFV